MSNRLYRYAVTAHYDAWHRAAELSDALRADTPTIPERPECWPLGFSEEQRQRLHRILSREMGHHARALAHLLSSDMNATRRRHVVEPPPLQPITEPKS